MTLRAMVMGAGWAGEGHTQALRAAGVDVVAMCGRTPEPARAMAQKLGIGDVRFDWRPALEELRPDIVAIATPAAPHAEMAEAAAALGCHVICDKPLGVDGAEARRMLRAVERAGVKHAYGTTSRYGPIPTYTRQLLADGVIGQVREIEYVVHTYLPPLLPYYWLYDLKQGGGMLNNVLPHHLGQVLYMTGGEVRAAMGEARRLVERAPVGPPLHDFRALFRSPLTPEQAAAAEWREVDVDLAYTAVAQLALPDGSTASALFQGSGGAQSLEPNHIAIYGSQGALWIHMVGLNELARIQVWRAESGAWEDMPVPQAILEALPAVEDRVQRDWNSLFAAFVADIRGAGYTGYPTFRDGWLAHEIMDIVRRGQGWTPLPAQPGHD